jgi:hypothetical protein
VNYEGCRELGEEGCELVMRWLVARGKVFQGRMVRTDKGRIAMFLQRSVGDIIYNPDRYAVLSIEVKTERRASPNLFLETWSNAAPEFRTPGWMVTLDADWLFYYFRESDELHVLDFQRLKRWAFEEKRRLYDFPERQQATNQQLNRTVGRLVPIATLRSEVGLRSYSPARDLGAVA